MADFFHRLVAPTYFTGGGAFPAEAGTTYDYINNGGGGTPSFADGAKIGGPNASTYFYAFGEDATSSNLNRANKALSENCDHLDNLVHRSIAVSIRTADVTPGAPVASIVLPIGTFLGIAGYTTSVPDLNRLFEITDDLDNEIIIQGTGVKVEIASVTLGAGDTIGGGGANGSFSGGTITLVLTVSIPTGQRYRVYYGTRSNVAVLPLDALTNITIRGANEASATVEALLKDLHGNNLSWNAAWTSTIFELSSGGLNDRYRRATTAPTTPPEAYFSTTALNAPGGGGWIKRDGPGLTVYALDLGAYLDPINALFAGKFRDTVQANSGGTNSFVSYGSRLSGSAITGEKTYQPGTTNFLGLAGHFNTASLHASDPYTRVPVGAAANLTTPNTNINTGEAVVEVTLAANYFRKVGTLESSIALGYDMLEVQYTQGGVVKRQVVVVVAMGSSADATNIRKVRVRNLDGTIPDWTTSPASAATVLAWYSTAFAVGDGAPRLHQQTHLYAEDVKIDGLYYCQPPKLLGVAGDNITRKPATFIGYDQGNSNALEIGYFQYTQPSGPVITTSFGADGSAVFGAGIIVSTTASIATGANKYMIAPAFRDRTSSATGTTATTTSIAIDLTLGSQHKVVADTTGGAITITLNITGVLSGSKYKIWNVHTAHINNVSLIWGGAGLTHYHSTGDDQPSTGVVGWELWTGIAVSSTEIAWTVTRYV